MTTTDDSTAYRVTLKDVDAKVERLDERVSALSENVVTLITELRANGHTSKLEDHEKRLRAAESSIARFAWITTAAGVALAAVVGYLINAVLAIHP